MQQSGIYVIENSVTRHRYVGSAVNFSKRRREHFGALRRGDHCSVVLQRAFDKHGEHVLSFRPLFVCAPEHLLMYEQRAIDTFRPEYNICRTAGSRLGAKYSEESRALLSKIRKGKPRSPAQLAHLAALSAAQSGKSGRKHSPETIEKIKAARSRQVVTDEHRAAIARANVGRRQTTETIEKIRAAKLGVKRGPMSDEQKAKVSAAHLGRRRPAETRERIRLARFGTKWSAAHYIARGLTPPIEEQ